MGHTASCDILPIGDPWREYSSPTILKNENLVWVEKVTISLDDERAEFTVKPEESPNTEDIRKAVEMAGFKLKSIAPQ